MVVIVPDVDFQLDWGGGATWRIVGRECTPGVVFGLLCEDANCGDHMRCVRGTDAVAVQALFERFPGASRLVVYAACPSVSHNHAYTGQDDVFCHFITAFSRDMGKADALPLTDDLRAIFGSMLSDHGLTDLQPLLVPPERTLSNGAKLRLA